MLIFTSYTEMRNKITKKDIGHRLSAILKHFGNLLWESDDFESLLSKSNFFESLLCESDEGETMFALKVRLSVWQDLCRSVEPPSSKNRIH